MADVAAALESVGDVNVVELVNTQVLPWFLSVFRGFEDQFHKCFVERLNHTLPKNKFSLQLFFEDYFGQFAVEVNFKRRLGKDLEIAKDGEISMLQMAQLAQLNLSLSGEQKQSILAVIATYGHNAREGIKAIVQKLREFSRESAEVIPLRIKRVHDDAIQALPA